jgi:hypothetical protein
VLAVKLNASDYVQGGLSEEDALDQVRMIAELKTDGGRTSVDIIEVSGGDYENPGAFRGFFLFLALCRYWAPCP